MNKFLIYILTLFSLASCTGLRLHKSDFQAIDKNLEGTFLNIPLKTRGRHPDSSLLKIFEIFQGNADSVHLRFNNNGQLELSFDNGLRYVTFDGKFKRGFYQIYIRRIIKQVPPLLPIIYGHRDIYRIRLALTKNKDLIIDHKWAMDGNIFILASGGSGRLQYQFKRTKTD